MDYYEGIILGIAISLIVFIWIVDYNQRPK